MLAVHRCTIAFHRPARLDDSLTVESRITAMSGATLSIEQRVQRVASDARDGFLNLVDLSLRLVTLDRQLRPTRLPSALRAVVSNYL
jgi:acyl-CoA thioester hydrolase